MYRKIIYISINLFEDMNSLVKVSILILISFASLLLTSKIKPYIGKEMNDLEFYSNFSSSLILLSGALNIVKANDYINILVFITVVLVNIYFGLIWTRSIFNANFYLIKTYFPKISSIILRFKKTCDAWKMKLINLRKTLFIFGLERPKASRNVIAIDFNKIKLTLQLY